MVSYTLIFNGKSLLRSGLVVECPSPNHEDQGSNPGWGRQKFTWKKFYRGGFYFSVNLNAYGVYFEVWMVILIVDYFLFKSILAWCDRTAPHCESCTISRKRSCRVNNSFSKVSEMDLFCNHHFVFKTPTWIINQNSIKSMAKVFSKFKMHRNYRS